VVEHKPQNPSGTWFLWLWMAGIMVILAVIFHTQAPLVALNCPPYEQQTKAQTAPEDCASVNVLVVRSWTDLRRGTGRLVRHYRDDITAISTLIVAIFTCTLWWVTLRMVRVAQDQRADTRRAINIATEANRISQQSLDATHRAIVVANRPWLDLNVVIVSGIHWDLNGANITISSKSRNFGSAPAINTNITPKLYFPNKNTNQSRIELNKFAEGIRDQDFSNTPGIGKIVFPDQVHSETWGIPLMRSDIAKSHEVYRAVPNHPLAEQMTLALLVVVTYRSANSPIVHYTGRAFGIRPANGLFFKPEEAIALNDVVLTPEYWGDHAE
jgi:hypothetical protein